MTVRASTLLHSSVRQLGRPLEFIAVDDLLLERRSGRLRALQTAQGMVPVERLIIGQGGNLLTMLPLEESIDTIMPQRMTGYVTARAILGQRLYRHRQLIGTVGDLQFDWSDGRLIAIEISQGLLPDLWYGRYHLTANVNDADKLAGD